MVCARLSQAEPEKEVIITVQEEEVQTQLKVQQVFGVCFIFYAI